MQHYPARHCHKCKQPFLPDEREPGVPYRTCATCRERISRSNRDRAAKRKAGEKTGPSLGDLLRASARRSARSGREDLFHRVDLEDGSGEYLHLFTLPDGSCRGRVASYR